MSLIQKEKALREKRTMMAAEKNIMGVAGKLGIIARFLGSPIKYQREGIRMGDSPEMSVRVTTLDDYLGEPYDVYAQKKIEELPTFDDDVDSVEIIGYIFDGLSRGIHMDVKYLKYDKVLTVNWKGYEVYREIAGELFGYAPFDAWESKVDKLHDHAKKIAEQYQKEQKLVDERKVMKDQLNFLQRLRLRWGI